MRKSFLWYVVVLLLAVGNLWLGAEYLAVRAQVQGYQAESRAEVFNDKVLSFAQLFVTHVLQAEREVDFETRLKLENAVRDLADDQILGQWQKFTESQSELEAQREVKTLLGLLLSKIKAP